MKYFLYVAQFGNFRTRSMLIPWDLLPEFRKQQIFKLKELTDENYPNIVIINYKFEDNIGSPDERSEEIEKLSSVFTNYADIFPVNRIDDRDQIWMSQAKNNLKMKTDFNHIKNYLGLLQRYKNKIIDSILVLNSDNGRIKL